MDRVGKVRMRIQDIGSFDEYLEEINFSENKIEFEDEDIIIVSKGIADKFENDGVAYVLMGNQFYKKGSTIKNKYEHNDFPIMFVEIPFGYGKKQGMLVTKLYNLLEKHNIEIDNSKEWHTKGFGEEYENEENHNIVKFNVNDAPNPKKLTEILWNLPDEEYHVSAIEDDKYANGSTVRIKGKDMLDKKISEIADRYEGDDWEEETFTVDVHSELGEDSYTVKATDGVQAFHEARYLFKKENPEYKGRIDLSMRDKYANGGNMSSGFNYSIGGL